jgi:hypothetical protein
LHVLVVTRLEQVSGLFRDERHAIEKIFREGPFIGELILLPFGFDC